MFYSGGDFQPVSAPANLPAHRGAPATAEGLRMRPGLAMSQDGRNWARIEADHHTGALFDVGQPGEWDEMFIGTPKVIPKASTLETLLISACLALSFNLILACLNAHVICFPYRIFKNIICFPRERISHAHHDLPPIDRLPHACIIGDCCWTERHEAILPQL
jgi:hypothetical protein